MTTIKNDVFIAYLRSIIDIVHEPVLILGKDLNVHAANESFYRTFQVEVAETEGTRVYLLGNGQWDIPALRKLLEDILPKNNFFKRFEVTHTFPFIGRKVMLLNARQISFKDSALSLQFPPIILLAIEDMTAMMEVADTVASHAKKIESSISSRAEKLEQHITELQKEIVKLKKV